MVKLVGELSLVMGIVSSSGSALGCVATRKVRAIAASGATTTAPSTGGAGTFSGS